MRWVALLPPAVLAAALGWLLPLPAVVGLALLAVPALATAGDRLAGAGFLSLPGRFVQHARVAASTVTTPLVVVTGTVLLAVLLDHLDPATVADDVVAGAAGAVAALAVTWPARAGGVADRWVERCSGRLLLGSWVAAGLAGIAALTLQPDLLPFPG